MFEVYYDNKLVLVTDTLEDCVNFAMSLHLKSNVSHTIEARSQVGNDKGYFTFSISQTIDSV